jgi:hypothetical protein
VPDGASDVTRRDEFFGLQDAGIWVKFSIPTGQLNAFLEDIDPARWPDDLDRPGPYALHPADPEALASTIAEYTPEPYDDWDGVRPTKGLLGGTDTQMVIDLSVPGRATVFARGHI